MKVIIAEKPSVAQSIAEIVGANEKKDGYREGNGYRVTWAFGHLICLCNPNHYGWDTWQREQLPMIPDHWDTEPTGKYQKGKLIHDKGVLKQLGIISSLFKSADSIIVATDAGREGELIFRYIYEYLQKKDNIHTPFQRLWISSLTDSAIRDGLSKLKPGHDYDNLSLAAKARSQADWLVGMNATRALTLRARMEKNGTGVWSVGRVQTPTLCMVCKRFLENRDFVSQKYFTLSVKTQKENISFSMAAADKYTERQAAEQAADTVKNGGILKITDCQRKLTAQEAPLLYDLTTLQKEANSRYSLTADKTLSTAQSLYEHKYMTYPRTGSRYIPDDVYDTLPSLISRVAKFRQFSQKAEELKGKKLGRRSVNASKVTDHHALLPTENIPSEDKLTREELIIYTMVTGRLLESVSEKCVKDVTLVQAQSPVKPDITFKVKGEIIKSYGWRAVFYNREEKNDEDEAPSLLPNLEKGDTLPVQDVPVMAKATKAPPLLTESTLLAMMESCGKEIEDEEKREAIKELGIGTPATRAAIIERLFSVRVMEREKKNLLPTDKGLAVYSVVKDMRVANVEITGQWECELGRIESGKAEGSTFNEEIVKYTRQVTNEILDCSLSVNEIKTKGEVNCPCPKCKKNNIVISDKKAYCPDRDCGFILWRDIAGHNLTPTEIVLLLSKGKTKEIKGFKSKSGKVFNASLVMDENFKVTFDFPKDEIMETVCPVCGKKTVVEREKSFSCTDKQCGFILWKEIAGKKLTKQQCMTLIGNKFLDKVDGFKSKSGKVFSSALKIDDKGKISFVFDNDEKKEEVHDTGVQCPKCHNTEMKSDGTRFFCPECNLSVRNEIAGKKLSDSEMKELVDSPQTHLISGFKSQKGSLFSAYLKMDSSSFRVEFKFPEKK